MEDSQTPLLNFRHPPIVELSLDLQFEPLAKLTAPWLSLFWTEVRSQFPTVEEQPPLRPMPVESFDTPILMEPRVELAVVGTPLPTRLWLVSADGSELIQIQSDRFIVNWRRTDQITEYPRYERVRKLFAHYITAFERFIDIEDLGSIRPAQCAVTYYNHIEPGRVWGDHSEANKILSLLRAPAEASNLPPAEDSKVALRFVHHAADGSPLGRLHMELQPAYRKPEGTKIYILTLTARGGPAASGMDGVLRSFDRGHGWARDAFIQLTTPEIQQAWEPVP